MSSIERSLPASQATAACVVSALRSSSCLLEGLAHLAGDSLLRVLLVNDVVGLIAGVNWLTFPAVLAGMMVGDASTMTLNGND